MPFFYKSHIIFLNLLQRILQNNPLLKDLIKKCDAQSIENKKQNAQLTQKTKKEFRNENIHRKRACLTSSIPGLKRSLRGSLTVEAALTLPFMLIALLSVSFLMQIFTLRLRVQQSLTDAARTAAVMAYEEDTVNELVLYGLFQERLSLVNMTTTLVTGGQIGILLTKAGLSQDSGCIEMTAVYNLKIPVPLVDWIPLPVKQQVRVKAWNMADYKGNAIDQEEKIYVFIADQGIVYHQRSDCSHLRLAVRVASASGVQRLTNIYGSRYGPCQRCCGGQGLAGGQVYITNEGSAYHANRSCGSLKRTIRRVRLEEAVGMSPCSRCGLGD